MALALWSGGFIGALLGLVFMSMDHQKTATGAATPPPPPDYRQVELFADKDGYRIRRFHDQGYYRYYVVPPNATQPSQTVYDVYHGKLIQSETIITDPK